jgi:hypothetical protein|tara:strand:+ start:7113 stop:7610 length:498 start_codon:yes stop_codon:yes gene_type:complete
MYPSELFDKRMLFDRSPVAKAIRVRNEAPRVGRNESVKKRSAKRAGFRSNFELNLARNLADRGVEYEYENTKLTYIPKPRTYTPDFYIPATGVYIEAKGHLDKGDRMKMLLVKEQHPDLDIRFVFLRAANKIYKGSKTTYADWATKHKFEWAEGSIPEEWYKSGR